MKPLQDPRVLMAAGAVVALVGGVLIASVLVRGRHAPEMENAAASTGQLQVQLGEQAKVDPNRQLRCFVGGQFVGAATLADCAKKNGVAAQALDVGLDQTGALTAGGGPVAPLANATARAPAPAEPAPPPAPPVAQPAAAGPLGECLRFGPDGWRSAGPAVSLPMCVQALFAGRCERAGEALYGRWSGQTLRLVPGRVETSPDNRDFRPLVDQGRDCSIPPL